MYVYHIQPHRSGRNPLLQNSRRRKNFAFLDINPLAKGHTLVIPKAEGDYLFEMDDEAYLSLQLFAKKVAKAIEKAIPCKRIGVAVMGLEVPHTHIHLIPINRESDMIISNPKLQLSPEEMQAIAAAIAAEMK